MNREDTIKHSHAFLWENIGEDEYMRKDGVVSIMEDHAKDFAKWCIKNGYKLTLAIDDLYNKFEKETKHRSI